MELARYVVEAVTLEGRSIREVARAHGVSKSWVAKMLQRYRHGGYEALTPRSKAARRIPRRTPSEVEDRIVRLRKQLTDDGFDLRLHYATARGTVRAVNGISLAVAGGGPAASGPRPRAAAARRARGQSKSI